jgi:hypothetical protein
MIRFLIALLFTMGLYADSRNLLIARNNASVPNPSPPVAGFTLWLDGQDLSTLFTNGIGTAPVVAGGTTGSSRVGKWTDKATGTNNVFEFGDSFGDTRPYYTNGVFGTKSALRFGFAANAVGRTILQSSNNTMFGAGSGNSFTILAVGSMHTSADTFGHLFNWGGASGFTVYQNNAAAAVTMLTPNFSTATGTIVENKGYVFAWVFDNTANTLTCFTNLSQASMVGSVTDNPPASAAFALGKRAGALQSGNYWQGMIAEMIVYPSALSGNDLTNSISFLKNKYGF